MALWHVRVTHTRSAAAERYCFKTYAVVWSPCLFACRRNVCSNMWKGFPRQWRTVCHNAPHCNQTIAGVPLVGARIAIHSQATIAMIAMMVVVLQCEVMRGNAGNVSHRPHCVVPPCPSLTHQCNLRAAALKTCCEILGAVDIALLRQHPRAIHLKPVARFLVAVGLQTSSRRLTLMRMGVPPYAYARTDGGLGEGRVHPFTGRAILSRTACHCSVIEPEMEPETRP